VAPAAGALHRAADEALAGNRLRGGAVQVVIGGIGAQAQAGRLVGGGGIGVDVGAVDADGR
jgi:hypothetical protein